MVSPFANVGIERHAPMTPQFHAGARHKSHAPTVVFGRPVTKAVDQNIILLYPDADPDKRRHHPATVPVIIRYHEERHGATVYLVGLTVIKMPDIKGIAQVKLHTDIQRTVPEIPSGLKAY